MPEFASAVEETLSGLDAGTGPSLASTAEPGPAEGPFAPSDRDDIELSALSADVKLILHNVHTNERLAFGPGVAQLCYGVRKHGSLAAAAKEMGVSYSKAWKIVGEAEDALHLQLVIRQKPKGCKLTRKGESLLDGYIEIAEDISKYAKFRFSQTFVDDSEGPVEPFPMD